ncbi:glycosyltransferase [Pseudomonas sichuanensis]|uniref:glycosyltransferase n=1 Tax=Pseudomonas sichuanensis TaxID=2213015 RepID=UPI00244C4110|nr:glycosyltransferase [Pseudomonas sichuanensis]MDH0729488.1 glycosyltransferase [Pseudomonas sichuanensis]MDH1581463.1 glycosyltransferase [Pseudomonas sichuanensis]MDH1590825.1 glycosyltransferase [Pseudomonas sichuanensis]MDH1595978.1 glycosyltransferase [Pseudomonas sichuanensis]
MDWASIAGGSCQGAPWRVGIAGVQLGQEHKAFLISDEQWQKLQTLIPLGPLQAYGNANGLVFERIAVSDVAGHYDSVLLIEQAYSSTQVLTLSSGTRSYLMRLESSVDGAQLLEQFDRVFLPAKEAFTGQHLVRLNQPLELPLAELAPRPAFKGKASVLGRDDIELQRAHFALCDHEPELADWLSPQWQSCLSSGTVPVHTAATSLPEWFPRDCYVDGSVFSNRADLFAFLDGMAWAEYEALASRLRSFLMQGSARPDERIYPYTVDFWINALTSGIALDASEVRGVAPLLSVVIPAYNYGRYLGQAVRSVLDQGVEGIEVLVVDNASTDNTQAVMAEFSSDTRVRYMRNRRNFGAGNSSQNGFWVAKGKYIVLFMADDYMNPGHVMRLLPALESNADHALGYSPICWVDEQGDPVEGPSHPGHRSEDYTGGRNEVADLLIYDSYITPSAAIIRRDAFFKAWRRDVRIRGSGDWQLMVQLGELFPDFVFTTVPGVSYRVHAAQHSHEFYVSSAPLEGHTCILEGVFERGNEGRLKGYEREVAAHLKRRLTLYPHEQDTALGKRVRQLCGRLQALAEDAERAMFSIIVTTYNRPELLRDALNSIGRQSFKDFEVILVNDNGDPVESLLAECDFPVTYIRQGRNRGPAAARNTALRLARGRYVVYLDDDDLYLPDHLEALATALADHPDTVVYTDAVFVEETITAGKRSEVAREQRYPHEAYSRERLLVNNYIPVNTFACPRALALAVGDFDESLAGLEDWDFLMRLSARSAFHHIHCETVEVRMRRDVSAPARRSEQALKDYPALYRELYARHSDYGSEEVKRGRQQMLEHLGEKPKAATLQDWLGARVPDAAQSRLIEQRLQAHQGGPVIGIIVLDADGHLDALNASVQSLSRENCLYATLKIIALTAGEAPATALQNNLHCLHLTEASLSDQLNQVVQAGEFDWFMLVEAGSEFTASGLLIAALDLLAAPGCRAVYGDEALRADGAAIGAALRPDLNLDLLLSFPASMSRHWLFNRQVWLEMGGFRQEAGQAIELDYILRLIEAGGFEGLGHISEPLLISNAPSLRDCPDEREVIQRHLHARGFAQARVESRLPGRYDLDYGASGDVSVSILILLQGNSAERAQRCMETILEKSTHRNYEVLLLASNDAGPAVNSWLDGVAQLGVDSIRCMRFPAAMAPVRMRNQAAAQARGDFLLWLDEGAAVLDNDWLQQMLNHGMRQEVGVVGAKLVGGEATISHAGFVLGLNGPVGEAFAGQSMDAPGYMQRLQIDQNYVAVSGKCLLINKGLFHELGGFDETPELQRWADVDLCLRLHRAGYLNVWTPRVQMLLSEDAATPASIEQEDALYARWLPALARDPFYNPNFSLSCANGFGLECAELSWRPLSSWKPLPTILAHAADDGGCGNYRVIQPLDALKREGLAEGQLSWAHLTPAELERYQPDSIVLQRQIGDQQIEHMRRMHAFSRAFKVFELDDYLPNLPLKSVHRADMPKDILRALRRGLAYVDRFVVSTQPLAEALAGLHGDIRVVHNTLDGRFWKGLEAQRRQSRKPRVGWAGGASHSGDLEVIADVVKELANEVEWVFFGMCPDKLRPYIHEFHESVSLEHYPKTLARMNLDLALAPVEQNLFNECKSNLRLLEYGACGFPVIASDLRCYQGYNDLPVTLVKNRFRSWVEAIRMHISDLDATAKAGDALRNAVLGGWMLEGDNLSNWHKVWLPD